MQKIIQLPTRYNLDNHLKLISEEEKTYSLVSESGDYFRVGSTQDSNTEGFTFVDPPGGPFLFLGDTIPDTEYIIDKIYYGEKGLTIKIK